MNTADAIMFALRNREPLTKTVLFNAASARVDRSKIVAGRYGEYPEDVYDALEFLDDLKFIQRLARRYSLTDKGKKFCEEDLEKKGDEQ